MESEEKGETMWRFSRSTSDQWWNDLSLQNYKHTLRVLSTYIPYVWFLTCDGSEVVQLILKMKSLAQVKLPYGSFTLFWQVF